MFLKTFNRSIPFTLLFTLHGALAQHSAQPMTSVCARNAEVQQAIQTSLRHLGIDRPCDGITPDMLARITYLDVSGRNLISLNPFDVDGLTSLAILDLSHNNIWTLPTAFFAHLTRLTHLSLADNRIARLPLDWLSQLPRLQLLELGGNPFAHDDVQLTQISRLLSRLRHTPWTYQWTDTLRDAGILSPRLFQNIFFAPQSIQSAHEAAQRLDARREMEAVAGASTPRSATRHRSPPSRGNCGDDVNCGAETGGGGNHRRPSPGEQTFEAF